MHSRKMRHQELVQYTRWVIRLRWMVVAGTLAAAILSHLLTSSDFTPLVVVAVIVAGYNAVALLHGRFFEARGPLAWTDELNLALNVQFALDIIVLAVVIHLTGGVESFLTPVYVVLVPAARRILSRRATFLQATLVVALLTTVFWLEYAGRLAHSVLGPDYAPHLHGDALYVTQVLIFQVGLLYLGVYIADSISSQLRRWQTAEREARDMALTDGLTGLYNQRQLRRLLKQELARSRRHGCALSLLMFDLDNFKSYNDQYGHLVGDDVLRHLADSVRAVIRDSDTAARYGGDEFVVVLPETRGHAAMMLAERLRQVVEEHPCGVRWTTDSRRVTISVGVATYPEDAADVEDLIHAADMALLRAKERKNRVYRHSTRRRLRPSHPEGTHVMPTALRYAEEGHGRGSLRSV